MRILLIFILATALTSFHSVTVSEVKTNTKNTVAIIENNKSETEQLYEDFGFDITNTLNFQAFEQAIQGFETINPENKKIITIIDFTLPSTDKRMFVLDIENKEVLYHTIVSHGRNSGEKYATSFSNKHGSYQSSLGFYSTENTYFGGNGYSLVLNGLEKGINDQAKPRAVVIHGADYCSEAIIKSTGRLGRSYGCPALPREINEKVINTIKNGSLLYIYADNKEYITNSQILKKEQGYIAQS